ncbi:hypothetical protein HGB07_03185 [Candidatus Roizmanbacteria bacterium]|nr:hypothetical protein [Candidatus Roizmanbacteria bacterium]
MYSPRRLRRLAKQSLKQKVILYGILGLIGLLIVGFIVSLLAFAWLAKDLPSPGKLSQASKNSTVFYDRDGKVIYEMFKDKNRVPVASNEISDYLKKATVAIEDKNFYKHSGISETGIIRGFLSAFIGKGMQGGSTITQQLIKNTLLDSSRTFTRKIKEAMLAIEVERRYTKDEILSMYLNEVPYGGSYWGAGTAAQAYFGKSPKDLSLVESAILAGIPQSPSYYSPFVGKKDAWKSRATDVLSRMREVGYITKTQEKDALSQMNKVQFTSAKETMIAPHFIFYVKDLIEKEYGEGFLDKGLKVKTTLSLDAQNAAQKIVKEEVEKIKNIKVDNGSAVVLDSPTGEILAMIGSYDYNDEVYGKYNVAVLGNRQPGSTMKAITYATALEKGYTPATVVMDTKTVFPVQGADDYVPVNYDGKFRGPVQLRFALGNSLNIPAVKLVAMVGIREMMQKAYDMGLEDFAPTDENLKKYGLSITLGGGNTTLLNMTSAFSVFARGGSRVDSSAILEITDFNNKTIYKKVKASEKRVLTPETSFLISHMLSDNNARADEFGLNSYLNVAGKTVAVKTGTTDDKRDNWAIGYTKSVTVGVWVGNHDNSKMDQRIASGVTGASPIWHNIMVGLLKKYPDGIMDKPDKVKATTVDSFLGGLPVDGRPSRAEYFIEGREPKEISPFYKKLKISKNSGKLANEVEVKLGQYDEKDFYVVTESDPVSQDGKNRWQEGIDAWAKEQGDDKWHYPTETSNASADDIAVSIKAPSDHEKVNSNKINIRVKIVSIAKVKSVKVYLNGSEIMNFDEDKSDIDESRDLSDGTYEIKVVAKNEKDKSSESTIHFGVNKDWDSGATPTPTPH